MALSNVRWEGMKAVEVMLKVLPDKIAGQKLHKAYTFALKDTKNRMLMNIPADRTGRLRYSIAITVKKGKDIRDTFAVVGPRRKKNVWNMQGWHAHLVEKGTKPHEIKAKNKLLPVFNSAGFTGKFAKVIQHKGSSGTQPFKRAIDGTFQQVGLKVANKVSEIMRVEIDAIWKRYGKVATR